MNAQALLLTQQDLDATLGPRVQLHLSTGRGAIHAAGEVIQAVAVDSAYRHFSGRLQSDDGQRPVAASMMSLIFDSVGKAERTFSQVGSAAHLQTKVNGSKVAVETVTSPSGLVSYWGFVQREEALVIITLDTLDPQEISIADLRLLVSATAVRLDRALQTQRRQA